MKKMCIVYSETELKSIVKEAIDKAINQKKDAPEDELLTVNEACAYLKISRPTMHRWRKSGVIPSTTIGKNVRFSKNKLNEFLNR